VKRLKAGSRPWIRVEGGLQLRLERSDVRDVSHDREIYGAR